MLTSLLQTDIAHPQQFFTHEHAPPPSRASDYTSPITSPTSTKNVSVTVVVPYHEGRWREVPSVGCLISREKNTGGVFHVNSAYMLRLNYCTVLLFVEF